jgi:hypothetical protein
MVFRKTGSIGEKTGGIGEKGIFTFNNDSLKQLLYLLSQLIKQHVSANYTLSSGYK